MNANIKWSGNTTQPWHGHYEGSLDPVAVAPTTGEEDGAYTGTTQWYGRKPVGLKPLPDSWIARQIRVGGLLPPSDHVPRAERLRARVGIIVGVAVILVLALLLSHSLLARIGA